MSNNQQQNELGALWKRVSANGNTFYTGKITVNGQAVDFVMFANTRKSAPNQPDWRIYESQPNPNAAKKKVATGPATTTTAARQTRRQAPEPETQSEPVTEGETTL